MSINFLICSERSGGNLITKIMDSHSNICGPSPKHIFNPVLRNLFRYSPLTNEDNWKELVKDIHRLLNVDFSNWKKNFLFDELINLSKTGDINNLLRDIFYTESEENGKQHLFIKENQVYEFLSHLLLFFSESKYVYQVRDPRDMALSWKKSNIHIGGIVNGAKQWQKDQQNSLKQYHALRQVGKIILIKYEDLISSPKKLLKVITEFLGFQFEEEMLDFYQGDMTIQNSKKTDTWKNLSNPILDKNKNKYREELKEQEIKAVECICYFEMNFLGYEPEYEWDELKKMNTNQLDKIDKQERETIDLIRSDGVLKNMEAKKVFYQKLI